MPEKEQKRSRLEITLITLSIIIATFTIIEYISKTSEFLLSVESPAFWNFMTWFFVITWFGLLPSIALGFAIYGFVVCSRRRKSRKHTKGIEEKVNQKIKQLIEFEELEQKIEEIISKIPDAFQAKYKGLSFFADYFGAEISVYLPKLKIGISDFGGTRDFMYLCKYTETSNGDIFIKGAETTQEQIEDVNKLLVFKTFWNTFLQDFLSDGWEYLILTSEWERKKLMKTCIRKDDFLLIFGMKILDEPIED